MTFIGQQIQIIKGKIETSSVRAGRAANAVQLLAVSKTFGASAVEAAWNRGQRDFGENYVQEAVDKIEALKHLRTDQNPLQWHLIGPLQSNKTAVVAAHFDWVQTIDRIKIAQRLNDQRPAHLPPLNVCIQVNVDGGQTKSGVDCTASLQALLDLAREVDALPRLMLRGLLAIPEPEADAIKQRAVFGKVKDAFDCLNAHLPVHVDKPNPLDTLSMGMSADFETAIAAGATMVRIGSAIFGKRPEHA
ncbi:MAG: YggS family pyridoxal phosphate-dependent enzyme [Cytophagales bacterium]|nr:YggS family pyridoxal phosphate-dependent enzyme [Cytophagales bacterium]